MGYEGEGRFTYNRSKVIYDWIFDVFLSFYRLKPMAYFGFTTGSFGNRHRRCNVQALISRECNTFQFRPNIYHKYHIHMVPRCSTLIHIWRTSYKSYRIRTSISKFNFGHCLGGYVYSWGKKRCNLCFCSYNFTGSSIHWLLRNGILPSGIFHNRWKHNGAMLKA